MEGICLSISAATDIVICAIQVAVEGIREAEEEEGTRAEEVEVDIKGAEVADIKRFSSQDLALAIFHIYSGRFYFY